MGDARTTKQPRRDLVIAGDKVNTTDREGLVVEKEPKGRWLPAGLSCELNNR